MAAGSSYLEPLTERFRLSEFLKKKLPMSCFGEGVGWVCGDEETISISRTEAHGKGPMASLLAALDYYPMCSEDKGIVAPGRSHEESGSEASSIIDDERTGPVNGEVLHRQELVLEIEEPEKVNSVGSPQYVTHKDHGYKAQTRAEELEELRQRNLTTTQGKEQNFQPRR